VQAVRQRSIKKDPLAGTQSTADLNTNPNEFVSTSSGSLSYQNQRVFGVRRLRFTSDVRLNSEALLPLLGGPQDQETAAWENRFDYSVGRTQFRLNAVWARSTTKAARNESSVPKEKKTNRTILFSITRSLGN
jgi:hypothetical protein